MPSSPMRFVCGTRTSSKWIRPVSLDIIPIFLIFFALVTPGVFIGTMIRLLFLCAAPSEVLASRHIQSACRLLVIHILAPLMT